MADQLSEVFDLVELQGQMTGGFEVRGRWVSHGLVDDPLKLVAVARGQVWLSTEGLEAPLKLESGDVAVLNNRTWLRVEGGTGDGPPREIFPDPGYRTVRDDTGGGVSGDDSRDGDVPDIVVGCRVDLNPTGRALLLQALPPVGHVRASTATATDLRRILDALVEEAAESRIGSAFAVRQFGQLLILEVVRAYLDQAQPPPGWLRVVRDERLRSALSLMHADPGKPWRLEELARAAAMSRATFAERFRAMAGVPPLTYLHRWRMLLAQRALRDRDVRIGSLAAELGYASDSAFSTAFKRELGEAPLRYRDRARGESAARTGPAASRLSGP
ncbi:AraC family transcriptional regulator [Streptomyces axinellae]|uniref:AraC family transcriptional regulator n=1 Tax=Streptomyces axinellae TaxID=552788 RepID=A0ABP6CL73_9ACTN